MKAIQSIRTVTLLLALAVALPVFAQEAAVKEAETSYANGDYPKAIEQYEAILEANGESSEIYYNLGNAYYKNNNIAPAILNYERALLLSPGDGDTRFNLQLARQRSVDRIEPVGAFFLVEWFQAVQNKAGADAWAKGAVVCFLCFIICLLLFFFSRWIRLKKIGFYIGMVLLVMIVFANVFAANQKGKLVNRTHAIIFSPTVTVKSSPAASGTDLFILHEGTKVNIKSSLGEWNEIESEDGSVGWMPKSSMQII